MILTFRPLAEPLAHWKPAGAMRPSSPFSAGYWKTLVLLDRELEHLHARDVFLQVVTDHRGVRLDGQLRADARVDHPGVILTIDTKAHGTLVYETDAFSGGYGHNVRAGWQQNLRAIALGLEALRRVERYGIARRGQQYAGYRELPTGIELGAAMTAEEAAAFLIEYGEVEGCPDPWTVDALLDDTGPAAREILAGYFRRASKKLHPDAGGDPELFRKLSIARELLEARLP